MNYIGSLIAEYIMKKILTFFGFFGPEDEIDDSFIERFLLINKQLDYIRTIEEKHPFHIKYIVPTIPSRFDGFIEFLANRYNYIIAKDFISRENTFEYPGFSFMSDLSYKSNVDDIFYYFHSKGTGNPSDISIYKMHVKALMQMDINISFKEESILKAGLFPSEHGWLWHNFFAARPGVLNKPVVKDSNRYAYEAFIGNRSDPCSFNSVYPLLKLAYPNNEISNKKFYTPDDLGYDNIKDILVN